MKLKYFICLLCLSILITSFHNNKRFSAYSIQTTFNIKDYGAVGDGKTDDARAIQKAIDACSAAGGGTVLIPSGYIFLAGPFDLKSFVDFHVEANAKVLA